MFVLPHIQIGAEFTLDQFEDFIILLYCYVLRIFVAVLVQDPENEIELGHRSAISQHSHFSLLSKLEEEDGFLVQ